LTEPITLTHEEVDAIVLAGMIEGGISREEAERALHEAPALRAAQMRAGAITLVLGMQALGWRIARPLKSLRGGVP